jgi:hypothetical protein
MRNPSGDEKIQAQSIPEIGDFLNAEYKRLARLSDRVEFRGRSVSAGTLLNAIVLHFASFAPGAREAIAREFLRRYEALLEHDVVQSIEPSQGDGSTKKFGAGYPPGRGAVDVPTPAPTRAPAFKRKPKSEDHSSSMADSPIG